MHPSERIRGSVSDRLEGVRVALGVSGSIAAVESVKLARELIRHGAVVRAYMTPSATRIVHPYALEFATGVAPVVELSGQLEHLAARHGEIDVVVVAPATANSVAKMALGIDDTPVTSLVQASVGRVPIVVAPAMHEGMMDHPKTKEHLGSLRSLGMDVVPPIQEEDEAKLADLGAIVEHAIRAAGPRRLAGKRVLVINGSTIEPLDDMRVITNRSTGRTGVAFAVEAFRLGADVEMWFGHGHVDVPAHVRLRRFVTVDDLVRMAPQAAGFDLVLVPAAISDFTAQRATGKRPSSGPVDLRLEPTPKVLPRLKAAVAGGLIGFKAESGLDRAALLAKAGRFMTENGLDGVVANDLGVVAVDETVLELVTPGGTRTHKGSKTDAARSVLVELAAALWPRPAGRP